MTRAASWNPLRIDGTPMPPALLLMCKLLVVAWLVREDWRDLPEPFLPFVPGLDRLLPPELFRGLLRSGALLGALALLCNRRVRAGALVLGGCLALGVLADRTYWSNNRTFVALALVLAGLSDFDRPAYLLRWQVVLVYLGAGLNKLLDGDWRSGLFFDHWAGTNLEQPAYLALAGALPPLVAALIASWGTILGELAIAFTLPFRRTRAAGLWLNAGLQLMLLQFSGGTFQMFFFGMQASALAFLTWPPLPTASATSTSATPGWAATCRRLVNTPSTWIVATALLAWAPVASDWWRRGLSAALLLMVVVAVTRRGRTPAPAVAPQLSE